jgi:hypothetical protein
MKRRWSWLAVLIVAVATLVTASLSAGAARTLSKSRAEAAIERQVQRQYRSRIGGRTVVAGTSSYSGRPCQRLSPRRVRCDYDVLANFADGQESGYLDEDPDPVKYSGFGTATLTRYGSVVATVTRPR